MKYSPMVDYFYIREKSSLRGRQDVLVLFTGTKGETMKEIDRRLDRMIEVAESERLTLDHVVKVMGRCDQRAFAAFSDKPSTLPRKM